MARNKNVICGKVPAPALVEPPAVTLKELFPYGLAYALYGPTGEQLAQDPMVLDGGCVLLRFPRSGQKANVCNIKGAANKP